MIYLCMNLSLSILVACQFTLQCHKIIIHNLVVGTFFSPQNSMVETTIKGRFRVQSKFNHFPCLQKKKKKSYIDALNGSEWSFWSIKKQKCEATKLIEALINSALHP